MTSSSASWQSVPSVDADDTAGAVTWTEPPPALPFDPFNTQCGSCMRIVGRLQDTLGTVVAVASTEPGPAVPFDPFSTRCVSCMRIVGRFQDTLGTFGFGCVCGLCAELAQVHMALENTSLNLSQAGQVRRALWNAYDLIRAATTPSAQRQ